MDGSRREVAIELQIVEGLKELPEWEFDLAALEMHFAGSMPWPCQPITSRCAPRPVP
jgi:hypothetical protein